MFQTRFAQNLLLYVTLLLFADLPEGDPTLFAEKHKYSLGEKIRANCTSRASYPAANLTWFVNGQQVLSKYFYSPFAETRQLT
jgi:hypothetical protein